MRYFLAVPLLLAALPCGAQAPAADEKAKITQTALDYIEGWYTGNPERMERALHPELAKRIVQTDPRSGRSALGQMSALTLIQNTRRAAQNPPKGNPRKEVTVLDIFGNAASVRVDAQDWVDYLHVAKWNGEWKIVNVLWELRPRQ